MGDTRERFLLGVKLGVKSRDTHGTCLLDQAYRPIEGIVGVHQEMMSSISSLPGICSRAM